MRRIAARTSKALRAARVAPSEISPERAITKLLIRHENAQVKIEVTPVLRGCVYEPVLRSVSPSVEDAFGYAEIQVVSFADLYAGKIVVALDRQHPATSSTFAICLVTKRLTTISGGRSFAT